MQSQLAGGEAGPAKETEFKQLDFAEPLSAVKIEWRNREML
jgi:hypothetical protein